MIQTPDSRVWNKSWCSCVRCGSLPFTDCNILKHVCPQVLWSSFLQAKEELQSIFPLSHENHSCGNALERVLALEIELAEALRGKQKQSTIHFQRYMVLQELERTILNTELTPLFFCLKLQLFLEATHRWRSNPPEFQRHKRSNRGNAGDQRAICIYRDRAQGDAWPLLSAKPQVCRGWKRETKANDDS